MNVTSFQSPVGEHLIDSFIDFENWLDSLNAPDIDLVDAEMNLWAIANNYISSDETITFSSN